MASLLTHHQKQATSNSIDPSALPSLSRRDRQGFLKRSHLRDGRLVLEPVPVSFYKYFQAKRQGGQFLLSFIEKPSAEPMETDQKEEKLKLEEKEDLGDEVGKEVEADVYNKFLEFEEEEEKTERIEKIKEVDGIQTGDGLEIVTPATMEVIVDFLYRDIRFRMMEPSSCMYWQAKVSPYLQEVLPF